MSAVIVRDRKTIESLLRERHERGWDKLDEMWNGVLHMSPPPHVNHQEIVGWIIEILRIQTRRHSLGKVLVQAGMREPGTLTEGERANYRTPDVALLPEALVAAASDAGWMEDGASLIIEVRSPREEFDEKLAFYASRGVGEALWIDRVTKQVALFRLAGDRYEPVGPQADGSLIVSSAFLRVTRIAQGTDAASIVFEDTRGGGPLPPP